MFLFEYMIKVLLGNSNTLFMGIVVVIFGYYGWLLKNIYDGMQDFLENWKDHENSLKELKNSMDQLDESVYKDLIIKLDDTIATMEKIDKNLDEIKDKQERVRADIVSEIKEETDETKEIMKILLNNRSRSVKNKKLLPGKDTKE